MLLKTFTPLLNTKRYWFSNHSYLKILKSILSKRSAGFHTLCWQDQVTDEIPACRCTLERVCSNKKEINYLFAGFINSKQSCDLNTV